VEKSLFRISKTVHPCAHKTTMVEPFALVEKQKKLFLCDQRIPEKPLLFRHVLLKTETRVTSQVISRITPPFSDAEPRPCIRKGTGQASALSETALDEKHRTEML
jgi:hypothetical protein